MASYAKYSALKLLRMKLRQTRARIEASVNVKPSKRKRFEKVRSSDGLMQEADEDISFENISPFSPHPTQPQMENNRSVNKLENNDLSGDAKTSDDSDDNDDVEWELQRKLKAIRSSREYIEKTAKDIARKALIRKPFLKENFYDIDLSDIVDDESMIDQVEEVLNLFPIQFMKAYCRYVFEEQNKDKTELVLKKSRCKWRLFLVKDDIDTCAICRKDWKQSKKLEHLKEHGGPTGFNCVCGKNFKNIASFYTHLTRVHSGECYRCPYCNANFASAELIEKHLKTDHHENHRYTCTICKKGYDKDTVFLEHINSHTGLRPHQCSECEKKYRSANDLREHRRRHNSSVTQVVCPVCKKEFVSQKLLNTHSLIHGEKRKYICNICAKSYKTKQNLVNHQSFHRTEKSFTCSDCGEAYTSKNSLNNHFRKRKHGPHSVNNEGEDEVAPNDNMTANVNGDSEKSFESVEVEMSEFYPSEINKQPLVLGKRIVADDVENDSDEETGLFICL